MDTHDSSPKPAPKQSPSPSSHKNYRSRRRCEICGNRVSTSQTRLCRSCYAEEKAKSTKSANELEKPKSVCRKCGKAIGRNRDGLCAKCNRDENYRCSDCGGYKSSLTTLRCRECDARLRRERSASRSKTSSICVDCGASFPNWKKNGVCMPCRKVRIATKKVCEICGGEVSTPKTMFCRKCVAATTPKPHCQKCGKALTNRDAKLCRKCYGADRFGVKNPNWKGKTICPNCGGRKTDQSEFCQACYDSLNTGLPKCKACGKPLSRHAPQNRHGRKPKGGDYCRDCYRGELTVKWNASLTEGDRISRRHVPGYPEWRMQVYVRDDFTCQKCGHRHGKLVAHHIFSYKTHRELRLVVSNGITLCRLCHIEFHRRYGQTNNTDSQLEDFLRAET